MTDSADPVDCGQWLTAAEAMRRIEAMMGEHRARLAICARAKDGLVKTRAERFIKHREVLDDVELPREFWWAEGHEAMEQNWVSGDFSTWIDRTLHWKAYGVRFHALGIGRMVPSAPAPQTTNRKPHLLASADALRRVTEVCDDEGTAVATLLAWAKAGELPATARTFETAREGEIFTTEQNKVIDVEDWERIEDIASSDLRLGIVSSTDWVAAERNTITTRMTGLHFDATAFENLLETLPARESAPESEAKYPGGPTWVDHAYDRNLTPNSDEWTLERSTRVRGGRPPAEWWDELWVEICWQLYSGELIPKKQADIENAMQEWLNARDKSAAPSTIRKRARMLWSKLEREDEN